MAGQNLYYDYWKKHVPSILEYTKKGHGEINLKEEDFEELGNRKKYSFRLEIVNDAVVNSISGSAVARDLCWALNDFPEFDELAKGKSIVIRMDKWFVLHIDVQVFS